MGYVSRDILLVVINVVVNAVASRLVAAICAALIGRRAACYASLLFLAHPISSEIVSVLCSRLQTSKTFLQEEIELCNF